ncbi:unnamed protein product, partial [Rotaria sordida]
HSMVFPYIFRVDNICKSVHRSISKYVMNDAKFGVGNQDDQFLLSAFVIW